jgi:Rad3-related DNA helicase
MISQSQQEATSKPKIEQYDETEDGFRNFLHDLADFLFPFPGYREYQDEILYETLEAMFIDGYRNVIIEGPTGIGKSPVNVTVGRVIKVLNKVQRKVGDHFGVEISGLHNGKSFYTTPQKSLRNQLAEDDDLREYVSMLKSRADYTCGVTGNNCSECSVRASSDESCRQQPDCTYWTEKMRAVEDDTAVITFAMLIVDHYLPEEDEAGKLSFGDRDLVTIDEGHNSEGQSASMFAGFDLSPWVLPEGIYGDAGQKVDWEDDRYEDVEEVVIEIERRIREFIEQYEDIEDKQSEVEDCQNILRKIRYCQQTVAQGRGWVVNINEVGIPGSGGERTTKKIHLKPVRVDDFLADFVWSRGRRRLITSATIPFRGNVDKWAERIGLEGEVKFIDKPTPFPVEHRKIHINTMVGKMSGDEEDENWDDAMEQIKEIASHHDGEKGLIHSVSYPRATRVGESLGDNCIVHQRDQEQDAVIAKWQNSDKDILVSPTMTEGVDLHGDLCRWQVLLKAPFANVGDNRVSYLLQEEKEWQWYYEETAIHVIRSVGRAVRGPEPEEAASFYVIDNKFRDVIERVNPPQYILNAITGRAPRHWAIPQAAPWR